MFLTLNQVTLVADTGNIQESDPVIYERDLKGMRIFTFDEGPSQYASDAKPYGRFYLDAGERLCIVPNVWNWNDASLAKDVVPPIVFPQEGGNR